MRLLRGVGGFVEGCCGVVVGVGFAAVAHAEFFEDSAGGGVGREGDGEEFGEARAGGVVAGPVEDGLRGFGGVAVTPGVLGEAVADFDFGAACVEVGAVDAGAGDGEEDAVADERRCVVFRRAGFDDEGAEVAFLPAAEAVAE